MVRASERLAKPVRRRDGHEGAEAPGIEAGEVGKARGMAEVGLEPGQELAQVALVGLERVGGRAPLVLQMGEPLVDGSAQVLTERQRAVLEDLLDGRARHAPFRLASTRLSIDPDELTLP